MDFGKVLNKVFGNKADRDVKGLLPMVDDANNYFNSYKELSNDQLRAETDKLRAEVKEHIESEQNEVNELKELIQTTTDISEKETIYSKIDTIEKEITESLEGILDEMMPRAFAIVKDTARRFKENETVEVEANDFDRDLSAIYEHVNIKANTAIFNNKWIAGGTEIIWDMIHYDVQLIGGAVLHSGKIAEMATGEGKTLVATLPVFLNALTGRGVHIVTVNDYLAKRDSEWMGPIFQFHGFSVDCIDRHQPNSEDRRKAYAADVTYGTNNEFGFDYLRDNMTQSPEELVQRKHNYTIVDEVDSVLIDDARTPLIISGPVPKSDNRLFEELKPKVITLSNVQRKLTSQMLISAKKLIAENKTEEGGKILFQSFKGNPKNKALIKFLSESGVKSLLQKTEDIYIAENNKRMAEIVDDLYFVIEERNNSIELTDKGVDLISKDVNDSEFFILPDIGGIIANIDKSNASDNDKQKQKDKLLSEYAVKSERVHTINQLIKAYTLFEEDVEYVVIENKVKIVDEQTGRIMEGRRYSDGLHQAIESKENVKVEASTQTWATITLQNYFRMYNKLAGMTGTAETEAGEFWDIYKLEVVVVPTNRPIVRDDKQDFIYRTRREKYNAVIDEVAELVAQKRPVLVGTTSVEISELLAKMLKMKGIYHNVLNAKLHKREADIVAEAGQSGTVTIATNMAGRGTDIKLKDMVVNAGGLAIIGTERHESRRVDRQLRGRSGRQGDPGGSQFYVSLEDNLMRMFGSERVAKVMDRLGLEEGEVIQHSMITKSIERAQKKVEENNFGIRKRLLEYDDEMNKQREVIYTKRRHALFGERIKVDIANMIYDTCDSIVQEHYGKSDFDIFRQDTIKNLTIQPTFDNQEFTKGNPETMVESLYEKALSTYQRKSEDMAKQSFPVIADVYRHSGHQYKDIAVPMSDGKKEFTITVNLEDSYNSDAKSVPDTFEKTMILHSIDEAWKEHLREMDDLRTSVQNATYEQKDPLLIYKFESFNLFQQMIDKINREIVSTLMKGFIKMGTREEVREARKPVKIDLSKLKTHKSDTASQMDEARESSNTQEQKVQTYKREVKKVGRNEPCPCGSGKKYKQCHGRGE